MARSKVSNGTKMLAGVDGRSHIGRRIRDITEGLLIEFPGPNDRVPRGSCSSGLRCGRFCRLQFTHVSLGLQKVIRTPLASRRASNAALSTAVA
jgi:hypothetical protein